MREIVHTRLDERGGRFYLPLLLLPLPLPLLPPLLPLPPPLLLLQQQPIQVEETNLGQVTRSRKLRCRNGLLFIFTYRMQTILRVGFSGVAKKGFRGLKPPLASGKRNL